MDTTGKAGGLPRIEKQFDEARACWDGKSLVVDTGVLQRKWDWTGAGLATRAITNQDNAFNWVKPDADHLCDWELPVGELMADSAALVELTADVSDDEGFTSPHIQVTARIQYTTPAVEVAFLVWVYPQSPGLRTAFKIRKIGGETETVWGNQGAPRGRRVDLLPVNGVPVKRRVFGYYSDTQHRNDTFLDLLKEACADGPLKAPEWNEWASVFCLEAGDNGIALVKESHKCVNQTGHDTGYFKLCPNQGLGSYGWGILANEVPSDQLEESWGSWVVVWEGDGLQRQRALKAFDRVRYPVHSEKDLYIQANTWGSTGATRDARHAARESSVLQDIEVCGKLGIDILQIDDGWQVAFDSKSSFPEEGEGWRPHREPYPDGWKNVVAAGKEHNVSLGLWGASQSIGEQELLDSYQDAGFVQYKLDFTHFRSRKCISDLIHKVRKFIKATDHRVRVNWDLTEISPRFGYYFAREYGSIYLANRKAKLPINAIYKPHTVLRDVWQLSKYQNLNQYQCSYQNQKVTDPELSDASLYSTGYCLAITFMGIPLLFLQPATLSEESQSEIASYLTIYREHRKAIFESVIFPIGDKPNGASWTGFQAVSDDGKCGYLLVFRELNNGNAEGKVQLLLEPGAAVTLTDLITGEAQSMTLDAEQKAQFAIAEAPGFAFYKYEVE